MIQIHISWILWFVILLWLAIIIWAYACVMVVDMFYYIKRRLKNK